MKRLDRFLLKAFLGPFIMTFFITLFILVLQFLWLYIDDLVGKGLSLAVILEFLFWGACTILPLSLPLATLLASIMTLGNLGENNELLAMKAAGVSLQRILYPLIYVAFAISVAAFFVSNNLIPVAYNKIYTLQYDISKTKDEIKIPTGSFYNGIDGYSLRVSERNKQTQMLYDVMIYDHTKSKGNVSIAVADSGEIQMTEDMKALQLTLYHGVSYEEENKVAHRDTSYKLSEIMFDRQVVVIPLENYAFQKSEEDRYGNDYMTKNLKALRHDSDSITELADKVLASHRSLVHTSISLRYGGQQDTANSRFKRLRNVFPADTITIALADIDIEKRAVDEAVKQISSAISTLDNYSRESDQHLFFLRRINVEALRKFTLSLACFIFFFIGAPLGAIIRKGGLGTPVIVSAIFFVLYWVVDISGKKLARDGVTSPFIGAFISTFVLLPIGVFLTWQATKDTGAFSFKNIMNSVKQFFQKFFGKKGVALEKSELKIVYMGTPEFAVAPLKALVEGGYNVSAVVTVPDKPAGRGCKMCSSAVKVYAESVGIKVLQPESLKSPSFLGELHEIGADLFVVVAVRMLPRVVWALPRLGTFNLHASLLPKYRGAAPINWAIINGEKVSGMTTFLIDEKIDTGAILLQEKMPIAPGETVGELHDRMMESSGQMVIRTVELLRTNNARPRPQLRLGGSSEKWAAPKLSRELCTLDWNWSAERLCRLIRGLSPSPAAHSFFSLGGKDFDAKIYLAHEYVSPAKDETTHQPGEVLTDGKTYLRITCGKGVIEIDSIQAAGKKRMGVEDFLRGVHC